MASQYLKEAAMAGEQLMSTLSELLSNNFAHSVSVRGRVAAEVAEAVFQSDYGTLELLIAGKESSEPRSDGNVLFSDYESLLITAQAARRKLMEALEACENDDVVLHVVRYTRNFLSALAKNKRPRHEWQGLPKLTAS